MSIQLQSKTVRLALNVASYGAFTDQLTGSGVVFPKADLRLEVAAFIGKLNTQLSLVDISNWVSLTCTFKAPGANNTGPAGNAPTLAQATVLAADLHAALTNEQWNALTHQHAAFDFTEAQINALPATVWCVFTALLTSGKSVPVQFGTMSVVEDGYGIADPAAVVDGTAYSKVEANALFERLGRAQHRLPDAWADVVDGGRYVIVGTGQYLDMVNAPRSDVSITNIGADSLEIYDSVGSYSLFLLPGESVRFDAQDEGGGEFSFPELARFRPAAAQHTHTASQISDSGVTGRALVQAATPAAARTAAGATGIVDLYPRASRGRFIGDGGTAGRGMVFVGVRNNIAGAPVIEYNGLLRVPAANPAVSAYIAGFCDSNTPDMNAAAGASVNIHFDGNGRLVVASTAATFSNVRRHRADNVRANFAGQLVWLRVRLWAGSATPPVAEIDGVNIPLSASNIGAPPDWIPATGSFLFQFQASNWVAGEWPVGVWSFGHTTDSEALAWRLSGQPPQWISPGGHRSFMGIGNALSVGAADGQVPVPVENAGATLTVAAGARTGGAGSWYLQVRGNGNWGFRIPRVFTGRTVTFSFWVRKTAGNSSNTAYRLTPAPSSVGAGSSVHAWFLNATTDWEFRTHTQVVAQDTDQIMFTVLSPSGTEGIDLDDFTISTDGAVSIPAPQPLPVARDMSLIGGNQGRLVGGVAILTIPQDASRIEVPAQAFAAGVSVQVLGGGVVGARSQRIMSITGFSTANTTISVGTASGGTQIVNAHAVNGHFDISTFVSRLLATNNSIWLTFAATTSASLVVTTTDI